MRTFEIKDESYPERCEICHQKGYFDSGLAVCQRCAVIDTARLSGSNKRYFNLSNPKTIKDPPVVEIILLLFTEAISLFVWINLFSEYGSWWINHDNSLFNIIGTLTLILFLFTPILLFVLWLKLKLRLITKS